MNCCAECFVDLEIRSIIQGRNTKGNCDFCSSRNTYVRNIKNDVVLKENFERLLDIYSPITDPDEEFPKGKSDLLKNILCKHWNVFNLSPEKIYTFITTLLPDKYKENPRLFDGLIGIRGSIQSDYLDQYSMLGAAEWEDFIDEIKTQNRFHSTIINKEIFKKVLRASSKKYKQGTEFYRARIWTEGIGFKSEKMGAPPAKKASAGRANPEGISCLYLANTTETALHETRAGVNDYATVGTFVLQKDIEIIDLTIIDKISPFIFEDIDLLAANLEHLKKIGDEISRPLRKHDSSLDYLPTQYISDYIKSVNFDGIQYKSTMCKNGMNFAIFDNSLLKCTEIVDYDIDSLKYSYSSLACKK